MQYSFHFLFLIFIPSKIIQNQLFKFTIFLKNFELYQILINCRGDHYFLRYTIILYYIALFHLTLTHTLGFSDWGFHTQRLFWLPLCQGPNLPIVETSVEPLTWHHFQENLNSSRLITLDSFHYRKDTIHSVQNILAFCPWVFFLWHYHPNTKFD